MDASLYKLLALFFWIFIRLGCAIASQTLGSRYNYKHFTTSRGYDYHYYRAVASPSKPTLVFLHGFPSTGSYDWHLMGPHFEAQGYGIVAPDMLGYGDTSKPAEPEAYRMSLVGKDIIEILDAEALGKAILVGHDWGSAVVSRLHNYYPDRFSAFAFLSVGYYPPQPDFNVTLANESTKKELGYEQWGYWIFFSESDAPSLISKNWNSFFSVVWPLNPNTWKTSYAPLGGLRAYLISGNTTKQPSYITPQYKAYATERLLKDGFKAPVNWYKVQTLGYAVEDDKQIPLDRYSIEQPVFFAASLKDYIAIADQNRQAISQFCSNATFRDYDADHWIMLSHAKQVNKDMQMWIEDVVLPSTSL